MVWLLVGHLLGVKANLCLHNSQYSFLLCFNHWTKLLEETQTMTGCQFSKVFLKWHCLNVEVNVLRPTWLRHVPFLVNELNTAGADARMVQGFVRSSFGTTHPAYIRCWKKWEMVIFKSVNSAALWQKMGRVKSKVSISNPNETANGGGPSWSTFPVKHIDIDLAVESIVFQSLEYRPTKSHVCYYHCAPLRQRGQLHYTPQASTLNFETLLLPTKSICLTGKVPLLHKWPPPLTLSHCPC